jgi:hypothetical protein
MMMRQWTIAVALTLSAALGAGCKERSGKADVRTLDADEMARQGKLTLADSQVVSVLRVPPDSGRIIYDRPVDLSLANAMGTRPDLVGADTAGRDTNRATARRDTTAGDATADTSGGAARRRRP